MTPAAFQKRMTRLADNVPRNANDIKKRVAKAVTRKVVPDTPVDTSQARSRWQGALNASPVDVYGPYYPGKHGSTAGPSTEKSIQVIEQVIDRAQPGDTIIVGNNVPYILRLNNGYSKQAPAKFIERAIHNGILSLRGLKVLRG